MKKLLPPVFPVLPGGVPAAARSHGDLVGLDRVVVRGRHDHRDHIFAHVQPNRAVKVVDTIQLHHVCGVQRGSGWR